MKQAIQFYIVPRLRKCGTYLNAPYMPSRYDSLTQGLVFEP